MTFRFDSNQRIARQFSDKALLNQGFIFGWRRQDPISVAASPTQYFIQSNSGDRAAVFSSDHERRNCPHRLGYSNQPNPAQKHSFATVEDASLAWIPDSS